VIPVDCTSTQAFLLAFHWFRGNGEENTDFQNLEVWQYLNNTRHAINFSGSVIISPAVKVTMYGRVATLLNSCYSVGETAGEGLHAMIYSSHRKAPYNIQKFCLSTYGVWGLALNPTRSPVADHTVSSSTKSSFCPYTLHARGS
jgi:hypothetical protein